jgi:hypothetical protein
MEKLKVIIIEKWPAILSYVLNLVAYFLFLLYKSKFSKTKDNMTVLFNDRVDKVNTLDTNLRTYIETERASMRKELAVSIEEYKKSKAAYEACVKEISKMRNAVIEIIADQEEFKNDTE